MTSLYSVNNYVNEKKQKRPQQTTQIKIKFSNINTRSIDDTGGLGCFNRLYIANPNKDKKTSLIKSSDHSPAEIIANLKKGLSSPAGPTCAIYNPVIEKSNKLRTTKIQKLLQISFINYDPS